MSTITIDQRPTTIPEQYRDRMVTFLCPECGGVVAVVADSWPNRQHNFAQRVEWLQAQGFTPCDDHPALLPNCTIRCPRQQAAMREERPIIEAEQAIYRAIREQQ